MMMTIKIHIPGMADLGSSRSLGRSIDETKTIIDAVVATPVDLNK
jgi:hypothetical protein